MSNVFNTPNMNLPSPIPGAEPGPQWSIDNSNCFNIVDAHNHAPGSGVQINPDGININADLPFNNSNSILSLKSTQYFDQGSPISGSTLRASYSSGGELFWNDGAGNQVKLTSGGSPAGGAGTITGLPSGTASAAYTAGSGTFVFQQATSAAANMDIGTMILRYPGSYPSPSGNHISIEVPSSIATGYAFTLPAAPPGAANTFLVMDTSGNVTPGITVDNSTLAISGSNVIVKDQGITQAKASIRSTGSSVGAGGFAISASCGSFPTTSASYVTVTNLSVGIVTLGNPVELKLCPAPGGTASLIDNSSTGGKLAFTRIGTGPLTEIAIPGGTIVLPGSSYSYTDIVSAGTYTYQIQIKSLTGTTAVQDCVLTAYEIK